MVTRGQIGLLWHKAVLLGRTFNLWVVGPIPTGPTFSNLKNNKV
jgi:hypothetical protein